MSPEVVFWEDEPEKTRILIGKCKRCEGTSEYIFSPGWRSFVVAPSGMQHVGMDGGKTACGIDATGPEWWWPT